MIAFPCPLRYKKRTLLYRFTVDDPAAFTKPWTGETTMSRIARGIYSCHEGNYSLPHLLKILEAPANDRSDPQ